MPRKKITKETAAFIKFDIKARVKQTDIAKKYGISRSLVSDIANDRAHKDVPWPGDKPTPKRPAGQHKPIPDHDPTDRRVLELEAEVHHLTDERNRERRKVKAGAKIEGLFKAMGGVLEDRIVPIKPLPTARKQPTKRGLISEHAVLHLSDGHHDQVVTPGECGGLETYDFPISCCRAERLIDTTLQWTQETLAHSHTFPVLNVLAYGDFTSGEIHGAADRSYFKRVMKNCIATGKLHALMYRDLAPHFDQVNVVYVPGNHGRRSPKKNYHGAHDNWDYLIAKMAETYCEDIENVSFLIPDCWSVNLDINGIGFNIAHGDDIRSSLGIPFYGLQRRQGQLQALAPFQEGPRVRYFCVGHFHQKGVMGKHDTEIIMNGPWPATDAFAYNALAGYTEPFQWVHGVNKKGITWRMDVRLKDIEQEAIGPQRYLIEVD